MTTKREEIRALVAELKKDYMPVGEPAASTPPVDDAPAPPKVRRWSDGTVMDGDEDLTFPFDRFSGSQRYFEQASADGSHARAVRARDARAAAEEAERAGKANRAEAERRLAESDAKEKTDREARQAQERAREVKQNDDLKENLRRAY